MLQYIRLIRGNLVFQDLIECFFPVLGGLLQMLVLSLYVVVLLRYLSSTQFPVFGYLASTICKFLRLLAANLRADVVAELILELLSFFLSVGGFLSAFANRIFCAGYLVSLLRTIRLWCLRFRLCLWR